jgi:hypothetical protein
VRISQHGFDGSDIADRLRVIDGHDDARIIGVAASGEPVMRGTIAIVNGEACR